MALSEFLDSDELQLLLSLRMGEVDTCRSVNDKDDENEDDDDDSLTASDGVPRVKFRTSFGCDATVEGKAAFVAALTTHGFVILTGVHEGAALYRSLEESALEDLFLGSRGDRGTASGGSKAAPTPCEPCGTARKAAFVGGVYENERGVPMWQCGYEYVEDRVREAFRVHARVHLEDRGGSQLLAWPSPRMERRWAALAGFCRDFTDRALVAVLAESHGSQTGATAEDIAVCRRSGGDLSVAYAFHYPNGEGAAPTLPLTVTGGEAGVSVKQHVDPSLLVVEPVADVPGLDVFDPTRPNCNARDEGKGAWVNVERASRHPASDFVVFGGRCLEEATQGRVKACLHRVTAPDRMEPAEETQRTAEQRHGRLATPRRFCFIFEQKLTDFYDT